MSAMHPEPFNHILRKEAPWTRRNPADAERAQRVKGKRQILRRLPRHLWPSWKIALVVGSVLTLINHGENILWGAIHLVDCPRVALNFLVPLLVSAYTRAEQAASTKTPHGDPDGQA